MNPPSAASPTPILDRLEPLPPLKGARRFKIGVAPIIAGFIIGIGLAFVDVRAPVDWIAAHFRGTVERIADANIASVVVIMMTTLFFTIAIHEAGHAVAGWLVGFRIHSIRIWRLQSLAPAMGRSRGPARAGLSRGAHRQARLGRAGDS